MTTTAPARVTPHLEARRHFPGQPALVAHHCRKDVSGGLIECQICDSDRPDATLVGVEVMVGPETYQTFSAAEKARWHAHKTEIPKVAAALPDLSPEEAAQVEKKMEGTYGKASWLWDPGKGPPAGGQLRLSILQSRGG